MSTGHTCTNANTMFDLSTSTVCGFWLVDTLSEQLFSIVRLFIGR